MQQRVLTASRSSYPCHRNKGAKLVSQSLLLSIIRARASALTCYESKTNPPGSRLTGHPFRSIDSCFRQKKVREHASSFPRGRHIAPPLRPRDTNASVACRPLGATASDTGVAHELRPLVALPLCLPLPPHTRSRSEAVQDTSQVAALVVVARLMLRAGAVRRMLFGHQDHHRRCRHPRCRHGKRGGARRLAKNKCERAGTGDGKVAAGAAMGTGRTGVTPA